MWWPWKKTKALPEHLKTGEWGEEVAERFLKKKGFKIIGRRVRLDRDELDIVADDDAAHVRQDIEHGQAS